MSRRIDQVLQQISNEYRKVLKNDLVGVYIHGSIAFECFNWDKSDIDIIVVVSEPLSLLEKSQLMEATVAINDTAPKKGIEMSVVLKKYCKDFVYPTPFELHFSNNHLNWYQTNPLDYCEKMQGVDADLAAHFTIIKHKGIVLCGEKIDAVFSHVDSIYYLDSIKADVKEAKEEIFENPVYILLNLCRVLAYIKENLILSKEEGGKWAISHVPQQYNGLIDEAIKSYKSDKDMSIHNNIAMQFCDDMLAQIFSC